MSVIQSESRKNRPVSRTDPDHNNESSLYGNAPQGVLAQYCRPVLSKRIRALSLAALLSFSFVYGFAFALFAPAMLPLLLSPIIVLALFVIWALPDTFAPPLRSMRAAFWFFFVALIIWPNYLAIAIPGLPWITVLRVASFLLNAFLLICLSVSTKFRTEMMLSIKSVYAVPVLLILFVIIQSYSIFLSHDISASVQKYLVAQTTWTAVFFASAYIFRRPGSIKQWSRILWGMALVVSVLAIWEHKIGHPPWAGHIPQFLKISDESVERTLAGGSRAGTGRYRAEATFSTALGLAEYIAIVVPFLLHFCFHSSSKTTRFAAAASLPLVIYACFLTDAKLGMVGCFLAILLYVLIWAIQERRKAESHFIPSLVLYSYPVFAMLAVGAMLSIHRFKILILGDASHINSTTARLEQYSLGAKKFLAWPFGYGIGQGAATLDYVNEGGLVTIDTYYLLVLLEYGLLGFIVYYGMFVVAIYEAGKRGLRSHRNESDRAFLVPVALSLFVFLIIKSVFAQQDSHPLVFMMLGAIMAISSQRRSDVTLDHLSS
jgi:hypothetical protein